VRSDYAAPVDPGQNDRAILRFALPALATLAVDPLLSMVDTAFVGRLGTTALDALAFFVFSYLANSSTPRGGPSGGGTPAPVGGAGPGRRPRSSGAGALLLFADPAAALMGAEGAWPRRETLAYLTHCCSSENPLRFE